MVPEEMWNKQEPLNGKIKSKSVTYKSSERNQHIGMNRVLFAEISTIINNVWIEVIDVKSTANDDVDDPHLKCSFKSHERS